MSKMSSGTEKNEDNPTKPNNNDGEKGIIEVSISDEMKTSFMEYSMSVITDRALPDVRDGLKPVHRRILYAMKQLGLTPNAKFMKSARIVGEVLGKYHPHGDSSVYNAMVNIAQDFSYRYPLIIGQGNFGSIDGDSPAAQRYTEAKMSKIAEELLRDIEKNTVDFQDNYDGTQKEPKVLPAYLPNLLLNGVMGIAVGMATNIPPHNIGEILDAIIYMLKNKDATTEELMEFVKGPDFPLGGIVYGAKDLVNAYATGRGGVVVRGEAEIEEGKRGKSYIIIKSLPFKVNRAALQQKIAKLVYDKKLKGIKSMRDESTTDTRIVIELKSDASPKRVLNFIYKHTDLETTFNYNMTALVDGVPKLLSLKDIINHYIDHRFEVTRRRTEFDLAKAKARAHILEGLKKALDNIDEVIQTIKKSANTQDAKINLMKRFEFTEIQAQAILDMKLQKLAKLEREEIENELKEKLKLIKEYEELLASETKMRNLIIRETEEMKEKYSDERRTKIIKSALKQLSDLDLIQKKEVVVIFTEGGYIKRTDPSEYKSQRRGGIGVTEIASKKEDVIKYLGISNTHDDILFFTNKGRVYKIKTHELPESKRNSRGKSINNYIQILSAEKVASVTPVRDEYIAQGGPSVLLITKMGIVKRVDFEHFKNVRKNGMAAISLKEGDELLEARIVNDNCDIILVTKNGQSIRFKASEVRKMGRSASGVRGIMLKKGDSVVGSGIFCESDKEDESMFLVVSEKGYGKKTKLSEYKVQSRGGMGVKTMDIKEKTGNLVSARVVTDKDSELIVISKLGHIIRVNLGDIPVIGRTTQGVRIMRFNNESDSVADIAII